MVWKEGQFVWEDDQWRGPSFYVDVLQASIPDKIFPLFEASRLADSVVQCPILPYQSLHSNSSDKGRHFLGFQWIPSSWVKVLVLGPMDDLDVPRQENLHRNRKHPDFAEVTGLLQRILADAKLELKEAETAERTAEAEYQGFLKDLGEVGLPLALAKSFRMLRKRSKWMAAIDTYWILLMMLIAWYLENSSLPKIDENSGDSFGETGWWSKLAMGNLKNPLIVGHDLQMDREMSETDFPLPCYAAFEQRRGNWLWISGSNMFQPFVTCMKCLWLKTHYTISILFFWD